MPDIFDEIATSTATKEPKDIFDTIEYERDIFDEITDGPGAEAIPQYQSMAGEFMKALKRGGFRTAAGLTGTAAEGVQFDRPYTRLMDLGAAEVPEEPSKPLAIVPVLQAEAAKLYEKSEQTHLQPGQTATKGEAVKSFIANAVGETLPFMSAATLATLTTGTPMAAFGVAFAVEGDNAYRDAIKAGATEDEANLERLVVGSINGVIEQMQIGGIFRFAKKGKGAIKAVTKAAKDRALKKLVKAGGKFGAETVRHAVTEGLEEALQETVSLTTPAMHGREIPSVGEIVKRSGKAGLGGMVAGTFLGGGGALLTRGGQKAAGTEFAKLEDDLTKAIMDRTDMDEAAARETARGAIKEQYYEAEPQLPEGSVLATAFSDKDKRRGERQQLIERQEAEAAALDEEVTEMQKSAMKEAQRGTSAATAEQAERKPSSAMIERRQAEIARSEEGKAAEKAAKALAEQALTAEKAEEPAVEGKVVGKPIKGERKILPIRKEIAKSQNVPVEEAVIFRDMSSENLNQLLQDRTDTDAGTFPSKTFFANTENLALGQKGNTGVLIEFFANQEISQNLRISKAKPGLEFAAKQGEFELSGIAVPKVQFDSIKSITLNPEIAKTVAKLKKMIAGNLRKSLLQVRLDMLVEQGWIKETLADGSVKYTKALARPTAPPKAVSPAAEGKVSVASIDDIPKRTASLAFNNVSHDPEGRGERARKDYVSDFESAAEELGKIAKTPEQKEILNTELVTFKQKLLSKWLAYLNATSRTASSFITGPANFPVRQQQKRQLTVEKRLNELLDYQKRAKASIKKKLQKQAIEDAGGPITIMEKNLADAEKLQDIMKKANAIIRKKGEGYNEKLAAIIKETGLTRTTAVGLLKPDKLGFEKWQLSNNLANIKRMKQRLSEMEVAAEKTGENVIGTFSEGEMINNYDAERVQIVFEGKPAESIRNDLKSRGFRWSPKNNAWQRKNTQAGIRAAQQIIEKHYGEISLPSPPSPAAEGKGLTEEEAEEFTKLKEYFNRQLIGFSSPETKRLIEFERKSMQVPAEAEKKPGVPVRITRVGKGEYRITYDSGAKEVKILDRGGAAAVRGQIKQGQVKEEEELGGLSRERRNQHIRDVEERIRKNDLYQTQLEADEIRGGQIGTGFYYVGKHMKGEMEHALEGEPAELRKMFTTDPTAGAANWDVVVQEALITESEEGQADTSGYMDVEEFIERVKDAYYNEKGVKRGVSERALGRAESMQAGSDYLDFEFEMIAEKRRMLKAGEGAEAIDDMIRNWADKYDMDEELIAAEFVGDEPKKLNQIRQLTDPAERERQLDLLAEQQILEEERREARKAVKEVLAENKIEVETRMVGDIQTETKRDLLGTPFNEGYRGKAKGFGFDLTAAEAETAINPKLEEAIIAELNTPGAPTTWQTMLAKLQKKQTWTDLFNNFMKPEAEMKSAWSTAVKGEELGLAFEGRGKATGAAVITPAGGEIVLLAYGADSATGYHEGYHILRRRLSKTDIRVLEIKYEDEEAEAAAFAEYVKSGKMAANMRGAAMIRGIWNKLLKVLERIKNALTGRGYATAEDIFGGLITGTRALEAQPVRGFTTKQELTNEQGRRDVMRRAAINARKARLKKRAGLTKKGPKIKRIKIKIDEAATPYLKEELTPDTALPAAKLVEFKKTGGVKNQQLGRRFYEESIKGRSFREAKRELREKTSAEGLRIWTGLERFFAASSTRLNNISPELFRKTRKYVYNVMTRSAAMMKDMESFLKATKKMNAADQKILDLAFKNGDDRQIEKSVAKYNLTEKYDTARDVLDDIYEAAKEVGIDIGYRKDYWHRSLKDPVGFLEYFQKGDDWSIIKEAIKKRAKQAGRTIEELTPAERAQVVNTLLRGYRTQAVALGTPGAAKERTVELIDRNINKFYDDFRKSIVEYIRMMNGKIAEREFFGRETKEIVQLRKTQSARLTRLIKLKRRQGLKAGATEPQYKEHISTTMENWQAGQERLMRMQNKPLEDTIGGLVDLMVANEDIRPSQEKQIRDILQGIFDPKRMGSRMGLVATAIYIDTLNSPLQAITQLEEFGLAFYRSPVRFIPAAVRSFLRKSKITPRDIGIVSIGEEFYGASMQKVLAVLLKSVGFEQIDRLGKETYINVVLNKYRAAAKKGKTKPWLIQRLAKVFGAQYNQVLEDLRGGEISDNVKYLLFNELLDIQPVALTEMPETYNKAGKWRILYTLKTFLIRRMDFVRNECIKDMKSRKTFLRGFGRLIWLALSLGLFGAGADALKDLIRGRPFDLADSVVDNLLRLAMFSKYQAWKTTEKGLGTALTEGWRPPTKVIDAASRDIYNTAKGKDRGFELWRSVPVVGEEYYWWFGEGRRKVERKKGKKKTAQTNIFD